MACEVVITHFVNPHLFFFCKINSANYVKIRANIDVMEQKLSKCKRITIFIPNVGDEVAVYFMSWKRMIRARVEHILQLKDSYEYVVWAMDYGFPFQTELKYIHRLPIEFRGAATHIERGGLVDIMPAEDTFFVGKYKVVPTDNWSVYACCKLMDMLSECETVYFAEKFNIKGHCWGELTVEYALQPKKQLSVALKERKFAIHCGKFYQLCCSELKTTQIAPWLNNNGEYTCKRNELNTTFMLTKAATPINKGIASNADLTNLGIRKVNAWKCCNETSFQEEEEKHDNVVDEQQKPPTKLAHIKACAGKILFEKENSNSDILENYKSMLPKAAIIQLMEDVNFEIKTVSYNDLEETAVKENLTEAQEESYESLEMQLKNRLKLSQARKEAQKSKMESHVDMNCSFGSSGYKDNLIRRKKVSK